jgi:hypothetical protein
VFGLGKSFKPNLYFRVKIFRVTPGALGKHLNGALLGYAMNLPSKLDQGPDVIKIFTAEIYKLS